MTTDYSYRNPFENARNILTLAIYRLLKYNVGQSRGTYSRGTVNVRLGVKQDMSGESFKKTKKKQKEVL